MILLPSVQRGLRRWCQHQGRADPRLRSCPGLPLEGSLASTLSHLLRQVRWWPQDCGPPQLQHATRALWSCMPLWRQCSSALLRDTALMRCGCHAEALELARQLQAAARQDPTAPKTASKAAAPPTASLQPNTGAAAARIRPEACALPSSLACCMRRPEFSLDCVHEHAMPLTLCAATYPQHAVR